MPLIAGIATYLVTSPLIPSRWNLFPRLRSSGFLAGVVEGLGSVTNLLASAASVVAVWIAARAMSEPEVKGSSGSMRYAGPAYANGAESPLDPTQETAAGASHRRRVLQSRVCILPRKGEKPRTARGSARRA